MCLSFKWGGVRLDVAAFDCGPQSASRRVASSTRERAAARGRSARCERSSATSSDSWVPRLEGLQLKQQLKSRGPPARPPPPANTVSQDFNYTKKRDYTRGLQSPNLIFTMSITLCIWWISSSNTINQNYRFRAGKNQLVFSSIYTSIIIKHIHRNSSYFWHPVTSSIFVAHIINLQYNKCHLSFFDSFLGEGKT